ncbi:hypothetical protein BH708_14040 [Brachybacterium sp. P6-10-X1]|uniref:hypothetical protein n=1 Tax=Brachybacterium sp. P6-10-X1 TaxID=1903186 RepID=UPI00097189FA|nr:hypothetical protein [Brachybacterium sp. P6-10-X1]APX33650.1 hypothetical protein BH708_14040 [Brachybacterium sp. P6-10-X1]
MSLDLAPLELLAAALLAVMLAMPIAFPVAAAVIAAPRRLRSGAGLALGLGLLIGVGAVIAAHFAGFRGIASGISGVALVLGLLGAIASAVFIVVRSEGSAMTAVVGILACVMIGLAEPGQTLPAMFGVTQSALVALTAVAIEAVVVALLVAALVAAGGRVRALQIGVAAAGIVAAVLIGISVFASALGEAATVAEPGIPLSTQLIVIVVVLVLGTIGGGVASGARSRRAVDAEPVTER